MDPRQFLRSLFDHAVDAVSPGRVLPPHLPPPPKGRTVVLAVGKAATAMADVVASHWPAAPAGVAVTRYGHAIPDLTRLKRVRIIEAGHPVPDRNSVAAARQVLSLAHSLVEDDLALVLISGGGSALWCLPIPEIGLAEKQQVTLKLLQAGAAIRELNAVRKALSQIKGGKLAHAAAPARVETLIISDVVGDDPGVIASGPTVPSHYAPADVERILRKYRIELPAEVLQAVAGKSPPAALRDDNRVRVVANSADALAAAARTARSEGFEVRMLGDAVEGDAQEAARMHAAVAREVSQTDKPTVILSGGEVTAAVRDGNGIGGPNTEFLLALAIELQGTAGIYGIACDTDGYDGVGNNAGALIAPDTLRRAAGQGIDTTKALVTNNSCRFFEALDDLVITGPTQTNVSDFRAILVNQYESPGAHRG